MNLSLPACTVAALATFAVCVPQAAAQAAVALALTRDEDFDTCLEHALGFATKEVGAATQPQGAATRTMPGHARKCLTPPNCSPIRSAPNTLSPPIP